jgi:acyl dehydratase
MRSITGPGGLRSLEGQNVGVSSWLEMTQARVDTFAEATGDRQWIHVDEERAKTGPFGATIVHGYLTLSLLPEFMHEIFEIRGFALAVNYGLNRVRFLSPVRVGGRVRASVEIASVAVEGAVAMVVYSVVIELEGSEKPACVVETIVRYVE